MADYLSGAKAFLLQVFAHRLRERENFIASFREHHGVGDFTSMIPDETLHLFEQRNTRR